MLFFTCASSDYLELIPIYKYCIKRAYPDANVIVTETFNPSSDRFLMEQDNEYVHVTDIDMLILPKSISHETYYKSEMVNGASYLRGAILAGGKTWTDTRSRICGGQISFTKEYYTRTKDVREFYKFQKKDYREYDEVMLHDILKSSGYEIPKEPYTFISGNKWNTDYRDVHIHDFWGIKYLKWQPNKQAIRDLVNEKEFKELHKELSPKWFNLINAIIEYSKSS